MKKGKLLEVEFILEFVNLSENICSIPGNFALPKKFIEGSAKGSR
jgi:hypothetical protein